MDLVGLDLIEQFRIDTREIWDTGGSINRLMHTESDEMVLTRVAVGEAPHSLRDRIYVMWNIRLRAELGFKEARNNGGSRAQPNRWGPPTTIKEEALCNGGCQYEPVRATENVYFPFNLPEGSNIRLMTYPPAEYIPEFYFTYQAAITILNQPIIDYPAELHGYDSFRSKSVAWIGTYNRPRSDGGLPSTIFDWTYGNVWRDEYPQDNVFWDDYQPEPTHEPTPTETLPPTATSTQQPTSTPGVTPTRLPKEVIQKPQELDWRISVGVVTLILLVLGLATIADLRKAK